MWMHWQGSCGGVYGGRFWWASLDKSPGPIFTPSPSLPSTILPCSWMNQQTLVGTHAQLLANVRFVVGDSIREAFLFCKSMPDKTTEEEIYCVTTDYLEQGDLIGRTVTVYVLMGPLP